MEVWRFRHWLKAPYVLIECSSCGQLGQSSGVKRMGVCTGCQRAIEKQVEKLREDAQRRIAVEPPYAGAIYCAGCGKWNARACAVIHLEPAAERIGNWTVTRS